MKKTIILICLATAFIVAGIAIFVPQYLSLSIYSAIPLIAAIYMGVGAACMYYYGDFTRHTISRNFFDIDFKYSKSGGEGKFHFIRDKATPGHAIGFVYFYIFAAVLEIAFVFFFPYPVKIAVGGAVFIISPLIQLLFQARQFSHRVKAARDEKEAEDRELEEQKRREEMGKWK